ncbi:Hsp20/alpha crystallin family protein [Fusibacter paucivorans]|uniref:Hsp20/alpha crystallin family protein n=1 Tax=Fusibacter paucivorans TaxID=76009 RepID=A0ABS5PQK6_9FIRM|nr:Hsp20/alpha crystallin family protein [Fusibacter paucivorans]MBS7527336.1 Hsp20/alpha crystallin family protein [Fusibacter paucivorans]
MLKINPEKNSSKHRQALDQLFYDIMEEKVSCAVKKGEHVINTFDVDVREDRTKFMIEAELPGFKIDNITIIYEDSYLSIIAQKHECADTEGFDFIRRERRFGIFRRNFFVQDVDKENIRATLKNGVLKIELPKL